MRTKNYVILFLICSNVLSLCYIFCTKRKQAQQSLIQRRMITTADLEKNVYLQETRKKQLVKAISSLQDYHEVLHPILLDASIKKSNLIRGLDYVLTIQYLDESKSVASVSLCLKEGELTINNLVEPELISGSYLYNFTEHRFMIPFHLSNTEASIEDEYWKEHYLKLDGLSMDPLLKESNCIITLYDINGNLLDKIEVLVNT